MKSRFVGLSSMTRTRPGTGLSSFESPFARRRLLVDAQREGAPLAHLALKGDAAAEQFRQLLAQMQPQTRPLLAARAGRLHSGKGLEQLALILLADADTSIDHPDFHA